MTTPIWYEPVWLDIYMGQQDPRFKNLHSHLSSSKTD